jgi:ATP-dependent exoDNAse (exonuclease V) alpha subunit
MQAINSVEKTVGAALSAEQRQAAESICGSGRGAELIVGVAGAGKTTLLAVAAAAFEASGCPVIGTATSGQAARTLGRDADLGDSRTLASLLWRLDHHRLVLDERSVVILDEVGMTEDAHLVALTARIEAAGAKLVLVGDHHQLGAVGPGGALAALVRRHPGVVHQLTENRRQEDPAERRALAQLRDGSVAQAVAWYSRQGRLHTGADREVALQQAVDAWAADVAAGHQTGLYAWRRANVATLNQRAREWMDAAGRLSGPELVCPGGSRFRAGDHVITLASGADGRLVTSQRAVIAAIDPSAETLTLRTDDGQHVHLAINEAGSDRLVYAYATTVHRCQGSTTERAHLFADGGGRELAYVAMSRARQSTHVWTVADDLPQAIEDLRRDWSTQRTPTWAIDTALPAGPPSPRSSSRRSPPSSKRASPPSSTPRRPWQATPSWGSACRIGPPPWAKPKPLSPKLDRPGPTWTPAAASGTPPRQVKPSEISPRPAKHANRPSNRRAWRPLARPSRSPKRSRSVGPAGT